MILWDRQLFHFDHHQNELTFSANINYIRPMITLEIFTVEHLRRFEEILFSHCSRTISAHDKSEEVASNKILSLGESYPGWCKHIVRL